MLQTARASGKWQMNRFSGSSVPTECRPFTYGSPAAMRSRAAAPTRVMRMSDSATYGLSVISTPIRLAGEPSGPRR